MSEKRAQASLEEHSNHLYQMSHSKLENSTNKKIGKNTIEIIKWQKREEKTTLST